MCIIYGIRNGYLCWMFLGTVDINKEKLPQSIQLTYVCGLNRILSKIVLNKPYAKTILFPFTAFKHTHTHLQYESVVSLVPIHVWLAMT